MARPILTLDDLYQFFVEQNKTVNFSAKDSKSPIIVTTQGFFDAAEDTMPGMLTIKLKVCHTEKNRNGSHISKENMEKALPTLKYRPILAYIHELPNGLKDFYAHNVEVVEKEDSESSLNYLEKQVGCFTADQPWLEYDEEMDKTYVMAYAVVPEEYTEAADIIRRKNGTKVSCELVIDELSYNAKEKYLDLTSFYFGGCTLLGCDEEGNEIQEGMQGARADISDFCHKEPVFTYQDKMIEVLEKLNTTLSNFNKDTTIQKGGNDMNTFEILLEKYNKTADDIDFDYSNMTDEELEAKFAELFDGEGDSGENTSDSGSDGVSEPSADGDVIVEPVAEGDNEPVAEPTEEPEVEPEVDGDEPAVDEDGVPDKKKIDNCEVKFELSHDDIRAALYNLLGAYSEDGYCYAWISEVYDSKFIYCDCSEGKYYRQGYSKDGDDISLIDNKVEVFNEWLSKEEKDALDALKAEYSVLKSFKEQYDAAVIKAQKDDIFESVEYSEIKDSDEFKALISESEKFTVEEIKVKADLMFAASMKQKMNFEVKDAENKHSISFNLNVKPNKKKQAYAGLFDED